MGDEKQPHALAVLELLQKLQDLRLNGHIKRRCWLVRDQHVGLVGQRHRDHHTLPLPAGKLVRIRPQTALSVVDAHFVKQLENTRPRGIADNALMQCQRFSQLLFDRMQRVE